jgi:hypothetical protein
MAARVTRLARKAFKVLCCRDYAKFDVRVDETSGAPYFTDANPNTAFGPNVGLPFTEVLKLHGIEFSKVLVSLMSKHARTLLDAVTRGRRRLAPFRQDLLRAAGVAARPELMHFGDDLRGSFDAAPADALTLIVAPCESARPKSICGVAGFILPLGALGLVQYRRTPRSAWAAQRGFLLLSQRRQQLPAYRR